MIKLDQVSGAIDRAEANARRHSVPVGLVHYHRPGGSPSGPTGASLVDGQWICDGRPVQPSSFQVVYDPQRVLSRCAADRKLLDMARAMSDGSAIVDALFEGYSLIAYPDE